MKSVRINAAGVAIFTMLGLASAAQAGTATGSMLVTATVLDSCTVTASPMAFGSTITNVGSANIDTTATLALICTPNASFWVAMDNGANAVSGARRMKGVVRGEYLPYEVYTTSARSLRWGQTNGTDTVAGTAPAGTATLTAYGRIASGTGTVSADAYTDTVTVTVNF